MVEQHGQVQNVVLDIHLPLLVKHVQNQLHIIVHMEIYQHQKEQDMILLVGIRKQDLL